MNSKTYVFGMILANKFSPSIFSKYLGTPATVNHLAMTPVAGLHTNLYILPTLLGAYMAETVLIHIKSREEIDRTLSASGQFRLDTESGLHFHDKMYALCDTQQEATVERSRSHRGGVYYTIIPNSNIPNWTFIPKWVMVVPE